MLDECETNPHMFKLILLEKMNPFFYNSFLRLKIDNRLDNDLIRLFAKADIIFFKSGRDLQAKAFSLIDGYLKNNSKEFFKESLIKECKKADTAKFSIDTLLRDAYNRQYFHYVFFEQNCQDMDIEALKKLIPIKNKEITQEKEHIIPGNVYRQKDSKIMQNLGFESFDEMEIYLNNYGNLLSLEKALNSSARDKDLLGKEKDYKESELPFVRRFDVKNFNKKALIKRNEEAEEWLKKEFFKDFL